LSTEGRIGDKKNSILRRHPAELSPELKGSLLSGLGTNSGRAKMRHLTAVAAAIALAGILAAPSSGDELQGTQEKAQPKPAATESAPAPALTILGSWQAETILGKEVRGKANENIGRIVDVIVDRRGRVRAALIDFGGFLGVGSRKIAIDWEALNFAPGENGQNVITLDLTRDQMKAAPEYKEKRAVVVIGSASPAQISPGQ
jgi:hypothetical protein